MLQHDNARPHVARICTQFLEAENIPVLAWPAYSPDMSPIEHVWDALDWRIRQRVPVPANIQQLRTAIEEEWTNVPQATINNLINAMRRRCVALREANGGHTRYWLTPGPPQYSKTAHFRVAFYFCQVRDGVEDSNAEIWFFNNKVKQKNINHPEGEKQAGRKAEDWSTVKHQTVKHRKLTWRKTTDQHRTADTRRLYRETNEGKEGDTAGATETMIKYCVLGTLAGPWHNPPLRSGSQTLHKH